MNEQKEYSAQTENLVNRFIPHLSEEKTNWMNRYIHFHQAHEMSGMTIGELTHPDREDPFENFQSVLPIARRVAAQTVGQDIVAVVTMAGPQGIMTHLDYHYGKVYSKDSPWYYIWKKMRDEAKELYEKERKFNKRLFICYTEPLQFTEVITDKDGVSRKVTTSPEEAVNLAETYGIEYGLELEGGAKSENYDSN